MYVCGQDQAGLKHRPRGWSLLHLACATGQTDCATLLIRQGADVQGRGFYGQFGAVSDLTAQPQVPVLYEQHFDVSVVIFLGLFWMSLSCFVHVGLLVAHAPYTSKLENSDHWCKAKFPSQE